LTNALVVSNCVTGVLTDGLRALFPSWDARGVVIPTAREWLTTNPNEKFQEFLARTDVLITSSPDDPMFETLPKAATRINFPGFSFWGLQPDSFYVTGPAPMSAAKAGTLQSRIAVTAFLLGKSQQEALAAFNETVYEKLGYFAVYAPGRQALINHYAAAGIVIDEAMRRWESKGSFLYLHNHPRLYVIHDLLCGAVVHRLIAPQEIAAARPRLAECPDHMADFAVWPVYPEVAARHDISEKFEWRTGREDGFRTLGLAEFLAGTYEILEQFGQLTRDSVPAFELCAAALES
jgi:polysaccharide biosynthesis acetyltransferase WcbI-like protein